ncbi:hypothetical protein EDB92DRAFT_1816014 [Lactarius akahatsu]|uniref:Uncharacterized protein n=1 Tax=Lactarius akahatsu TaxID=416441 RepID=A0AAD4LH65_9AGAM|nr:hypothetical protein EDB92DRAFT_1816014 [Lactarius akahatsu]
MTRGVRICTTTGAEGRGTRGEILAFPKSPGHGLTVAGRSKYTCSTHEIRTVFYTTNPDTPTGRVKETAVFEDLFVGVEDSSSGKATVEMQDWDSHPNFEVAMGQSRTVGRSIGVEDGGGCVSEGNGNGNKAVEARANDPGSNQKRGIGLAGLDQEPTLAAERGQRTVTPGLIGSSLEGLVLGCHQSNLTRAGIKGGADIFNRKEVVYREKLGTYDRNDMEKGGNGEL